MKVYKMIDMVISEFGNCNLLLYFFNEDKILSFGILIK